MRFFLISVNLFLSYLFAKQSKGIFYSKISFWKLLPEK